MISRASLLVACLLVMAGCTVKNDFSQPSDALVTPSGLASKVLRVGLGNGHPTPTTTVRVHYTGWTPEGMMFDSSFSHGQAGQPGPPMEIPLNRVIPGWTEGVQLMVVGEKRRFWVPANLAYGDTPPGKAAFDPKTGEPPTGPLVFDIELLAVR